MVTSAIDCPLFLLSSSYKSDFAWMLQALETLGVLAFIGATDLESTEVTMELLWSVINHRHSPEDQVLHNMLVKTHAI